MVSLGLAHPLDKCLICGNLITKDSLSEHLKADLRMLEVIRANHPDWSHQRCTEYFREICGTSKSSRAGLEGDLQLRADQGEPDARGGPRAQETR